LFVVVVVTHPGVAGVGTGEPAGKMIYCQDVSDPPGKNVKVIESRVELTNVNDVGLGQVGNVVNGADAADQTFVPPPVQTALT
jgi:hypothetical protein